MSDSIIENALVNQEGSDMLSEQPQHALSNLNSYVRESSCVSFGRSFVVGVSLTGSSHRVSGQPCQDFHIYDNLGEGWELFLVSDGAGSAKYSEKGSAATCKAAQALIHQLLDQKDWKSLNCLPSEVDWYIQMRALFESIKVFFRKKALEIGEDTCEEDFNSTLLIALVTPYGILSAHIGDGRMGYLSKDDEWKSLMAPHKGEEANQTLFVQSNWAVPMVPSFTVSGLSVPEVRVVNDIPKAIVLITDGMEKAMWQCNMFDEELQRNRDINTPHPGFMNPFVDSLMAESVEGRVALLCDIMESGTPACEKAQDDKTVLIGVFKNAIPSEL